MFGHLCFQSSVHRDPGKETDASQLCLEFGMLTFTYMCARGQVGMLECENVECEQVSLIPFHVVLRLLHPAPSCKLLCVQRRGEEAGAVWLRRNFQGCHLVELRMRAASGLACFHGWGTQRTAQEAGFALPSVRAGTASFGLTVGEDA